jgi:hypothetical protein
MMSGLLSLVVSAATAASASPAKDRLERVVASVSSEAVRVVPGKFEVVVRPDGDRFKVKVTKERTCLKEKRVTETVEVYSPNPDALPIGIGAIVVGALGVAGGAVAASAAPAQPALDDEFSRGEMSREAMYGIAAAGLLGGTAAAVAGGAYLLVGQEELHETVERTRVVSSVDTHCESEVIPDAVVTLSPWGGEPLTQRTNKKGRATFAIQDVPVLPPDDRPWGLINVAIDLDDKDVDLGPFPVNPDPATLIESVKQSEDVAELERFKQRYPGSPLWQELAPKYAALVEKEREAAEEARLAAEATLRESRATSALAAENKMATRPEATAGSSPAANLERACAKRRSIPLAGTWISTAPAKRMPFPVRDARTGQKIESSYYIIHTRILTILPTGAIYWSTAPGIRVTDGIPAIIADGNTLRPDPFIGLYPAVVGYLEMSAPSLILDMGVEIGNLQQLRGMRRIYGSEWECVSVISIQVTGTLWRSVGVHEWVSMEDFIRIMSRPLTSP